MDIRQLEVLEAAARRGGFTRAGEELGISQSTVSQHIRQLENELGCPLFLRVGRRVVASEAGRVLLQYAERILRDARNAEMAVREMSALKRGTVRLGAGPTTVVYRLPAVLAAYKRRFPEIELVVVAATTEAMLTGVASHRLDLAVVMEPHAAPGLAITPLGSEELVVIVSRKDAMARRRSLTAADLAKMRFILFEKGSAMQMLLDEYFARVGVAPRVTMEVENVEAAKALVRAGMGASILPVCAVKERAQAAHLHVLRVAGHPLERRLGLVTLDAAMLPGATRELAARLTAALRG